jgi:ethanolamine ammonia-lyase small subunit
MNSLRDFTSARVALGRSGNSVATHELLDFQLAHAQARDAVHLALDARSLALDLEQRGLACEILHSAAPDRTTYLRRPDLGRRLSATSQLKKSPCDAVFIVADGLSALAIHCHAIALLDATLSKLDRRDWRLAPIMIVEQARVAIGDAIGAALQADLAIVLIGERPGLSSPDSLGVYLTWNPEVGRVDAERNCISNIRAEGLGYDLAAHRLHFLMTESRLLKLSGVPLKESAALLPPSR